MSKNHKKSKKLIRQPNELISIDRKKCIACTACAINCTKLTNISVLKLNNPNKKYTIPKERNFNNSGCIYCGQCTLLCPTGSIDAENSTNKIIAAKESNKYMVAIFAPSVKATLGEEFNLPIGTNVSEKLVPSAKALGFKKVFTTDFGADLTVVEEAKELFKRITRAGVLPMFTSCCPSWIKWVERFKPELLPCISTCKSPQQMIGATIKTYFAKIKGIPPENIFIASIKPCTSKKFEAKRPGMGRNNYFDIDAVLTVREYAKFLKENSIDINTLKPENPDTLLGEYSGAGNLFGSSGGVLKSTLRTLYYYFNNKNPDLTNNINLVDLNGFPGVKVVNYNINGSIIKTAAISGISNLIKFLDSGLWINYHFIEVMACPGGCINGGGTPKVSKKDRVNEKLCISCGTCINNCPVNAINFNSKNIAEISINKCVGCTLCSNLCRSNAISVDYYDKSTNSLLETNYIALRKFVLEEIDLKSEIRFSHENKDIQTLYNLYLGEVGGLKAEKFLHIKYT
ncbi:[FeFe] hydrogenase, group A [Clostridium septicum]|nr:[FeFe] hydrogenase, group A [Clostridium septicum]MDU1313774.1 [FeFe] hydrogenase, group A [Clostridium septicum]UEC21663.1 [FeFe] hydrogenase, group A [Clostridium septicum]WLF68838.1 [FeFe] hydrogenase, group A [Clostridium septicum]